MAVRGGLLVGIFLCMTILPLLASAYPKPVAQPAPNDKQAHHNDKNKPHGGKHPHNNDKPHGGKNPQNNDKVKHKDKKHQDPKHKVNNQPDAKLKPQGNGQPNPQANAQLKPDLKLKPPQPDLKPNPQLKPPTNSYTGDVNPNEEPAPVEGHKKAERQTQKKGMNLEEGYYENECPQAEKIVQDVVKRHFTEDPSLAPALVRLFFHDCFVKGCDASILLDKTPEGKDVEKKASHNGPFVKGYDVIDDIKAHIEEECPGIVSCADILAFASRDALVFTGMPHFNVPAGRRDGLSSLAENVQGNLPLPTTPIKEIGQIFQKKNMTLEELVVLIGAHSIGSARCKIVAPRFHDKRNMEMDQGYVIMMQLMTICQNDQQDLPFDPYSHHKMDSRFYRELLGNKALLESDHNIAKDPRARDVMTKLVDDQDSWVKKFTTTFIKMGRSAVLTGNNGEIRKQCRAVNKVY